MASRQTEFQIERADAIVSALTTHLDRIVEGMGRVFARTKARRVAKAEETGAVCESILATVNTDRDALIAAEKALEAELGDDAEVLQERDEAASEVRTRLVKLRSVMESACSAADVARVGFVGATPVDAVGLASVAEKVLDAVAKKAPRSVHEGVTFNARVAVERLNEPTERLKKANAAVRVEKREEQRARADRDKALVVCADTVRAMGLVVEGMLRAAGDHDLADRLRVTARAPSEEPDETPEPSPKPEG